MTKYFITFDYIEGQVHFTSKHKEDELRPGDDDPNFVHAFNGYSPAADIEGDPVYVNYARVEDLRELEEKGVSVEGKICIARYVISYMKSCGQL